MFEQEFSMHASFTCEMVSEDGGRRFVYRATIRNPHFSSTKAMFGRAILEKFLVVEKIKRRWFSRRSVSTREPVWRIETSNSIMLIHNGELLKADDSVGLVEGVKAAAANRDLLLARRFIFDAFEPIMKELVEIQKKVASF